MIINGTNTLAYGLVPTSVTGAYDLPPRYGNWYYDWGDEIELLWNDVNFKFSNRTIVANFLYDPKRQSIGIPSSTYLDSYLRTMLEQPNDIVITLSDAVGAMGTYNVVLESATNHKRYKGLFQTVTMTFYERIPSFPGTAPVTASGGSPSIDGYNFSQFGLVVSRDKDFATLSGLFSSPETQYNEPGKKSQYRPKTAFLLEGYLIGDNADQAITRLHSLQAVLSKQGTMTLSWGGSSLEVACVSGMNATKLNAKTFRVTINLIRV